MKKITEQSELDDLVKNWTPEEWESARLAGTQEKDGKVGDRDLRGCAYLCSISKQFCEPSDFSPCGGTGGTCTYYCW